MASLKAIRKRISSVRSTQKITKAMKMVAAARLRRAQNAAIAARPYADKLEGMVRNVLARTTPDAHPLLQKPEKSGAHLVLFVSGDRGLCGGYNSNLAKAADQFAREHADHLQDVQFEIVGRKGADHVRRRGWTIRTRHPFPDAASAGSLTRSLARSTEELFARGEVTAVSLIYSNFKSTLSQVPVVERVLPFERQEETATNETLTDYLFEPAPADIIGYLLPRLIEVRILHALLEAGASEQAARMTAMDAATRNSSELINRLTLEMNRARQAAITKELMEIIGGAEALQQG